MGCIGGCTVVGGRDSNQFYGGTRKLLVLGQSRREGECGAPKKNRTEGKNKKLKTSVKLEGQGSEFKRKKGGLIIETSCIAGK